jgi:hypothetical protein
LRTSGQAGYVPERFLIILEGHMGISQPSGSGIAVLLRWGAKMKSDRERPAGAPNARTAKELVRLAETSPHLLCDIGFGRDPRASTPTREVWRREGLCLVVVRQDAGATARIEAPAERRRDLCFAMTPLVPDVRPVS